jgi:hypothetical protein
VVDICEDYWLILRVETDMFCNLPPKMFKDNLKLIAQLKKAFIIKMMVMSLLGFLFSHEEFTFKDSHLRHMIQLVHVNFIVFMQVILNKMSNTMLAANFWARSLQQIVS